MKGLVDPTNELGDIKGLTADLSDAVNQRVDNPPQEPQAVAAPVIPDKYKGKTKAQLMEMHQNAETQLGRAGNEVGEYRQLTDELLSLKRKEDLVSGGADPIEITSSDLLDKPTESVRSVVEDILSSRDRQSQEEVELVREAQAKFNTLHPDAAVVANSPEFQAWVQESPLRQRAAMAAVNNDLSSADILLSEYKGRTMSNNIPETNEKPDLESARKAGTESVGSSDASASSGKLYRRIDLIKLKLEQPELYADEGYQNEIMKAYAEGRVR